MVDSCPVGEVVNPYTDKCFPIGKPFADAYYDEELDPPSWMKRVLTLSDDGGIVVQDTSLHNSEREALQDALETNWAFLKGNRFKETFRVLVRPEGSDELTLLKEEFPSELEATTFANIETVAGMGEDYFVVREED